LAPAPPRVVLPVYFHWEFRTGPEGDFESLALALKPSVPDGVGTRTIDISEPGFPASGATIAQMEGALLPIPPTQPPNTPPPPPRHPHPRTLPPPPPPPVPIRITSKRSRASTCNKPSCVRAIFPPADPPLAPPTYGRWHAGTAVADPTGTTWLDQLNLDPRW